MIGIITEVHYQNDQRENKFVVYWSSQTIKKQRDRWSCREIKKVNEAR